MVNDIQQAIINEKESPELLNYNANIVEWLDDYIVRQEEGLSQIKATAQDNFFSDIYKLEIERMKYMLKSYLRIRLTKIEKYYLDIIRNEKTDILSNAEFNYAARYFVMKKTHFEKSFTKDIPETFNDFVDDVEGQEAHENNPVNPLLVTPPDLQKFVFIKSNQAGKVELGDGESDLSLKMDEVILLPYATARTMLSNGTANLA